ncbi:MAG: amidohydrolase family protein [Candidatus Omnitrophota bacterium]|nr:MAG: amidohydrolase family protein [Candidatus Omnitrophota bacterium]
MDTVIDAHVHIGSSTQDYFQYIRNSNIKGAVIFPHVDEIYARYISNFKDNKKWQNRRKVANDYVLSLKTVEDFKVFPFYFVWNDFNTEKLAFYNGIKWHRHSDEPTYDYKSEKCKGFVNEIQKRNLPVILEEEFENTLLFINSLAPKARVIIPHCGLLNGGYERFCKFTIWEKEKIYTDTSLAEPEIVEDYIKRYGHDRIMFGSDFPFGFPKMQLNEILELEISEEAKEAITTLNILKLLGEKVKQKIDMK